MLRRRWTSAAIAAVVLLCGAAVANAQPAVVFGSGGTYHKNDPSTLAPTVTVTCGGNVWTNSDSFGHIRLIIPPSGGALGNLNFYWDNSVVGGQVTYSGAMAGNMQGQSAIPPSPVVVYSNFDGVGYKTVILKVQNTFLISQSVLISGLKFMNFGAPCNGQITASYTGSDTVPSLFPTATFTIVNNPVVASVSPAANQVVDPPPQPAAITCTPLSITDQSPPGIWNAKNLRISIPTGVHLTWDTSMTSVGISMSATTGAVSSAVSFPGSFEDGNKTLVLDVTSDFSAGDQVTISNMKFLPTIAGDSVAPAALFVTTNGAGAFAGTGNQAADGFTKRVLGLPKISVAGGNKSYVVGDNATATGIISVTSAAVTPSKITALNGIRLVIPAGLGMTWDTSIKQIANGLIFNGTGGQAHVTAALDKISYPNSKTAIILLDTDFGVDETLTIDGMKFTSFSTASAAQTLTLNTIASSNVTSTTYAIGAPAIASQVGPNGQIFAVDAINPNKTAAAADILVSDDAQNPAVNCITSTGIRIRIPSLPAPTPSLVWDTTVGSVTCSGNAVSLGFMTGVAGPATQAVSVSYEDAGKTAVISVNSNWTGLNRSVLISGLVFKNFTQPMTPRKLGLVVRGTGGPVAANDLRNIAIGGTPTLDSASNQTFTFNDPVTGAATITVKDAGGVPTITALKNITLVIPATFPMTWDTTRQTRNNGLTFTGLASTTRIAQLNTDVVITYSPDAKTATIDVTSDFAADEDLIIAGMRFQNFTAANGFDNLQLFVDPPPGGTAILDSKTIGIGAPTITLANSHTFGAGDPPTTLSQITITEDGTVARITPTGLEIHIGAVNAEFDPSVTSPTFSGSAFTNGRVTTAATKVTYSVDRKTATIVLNTTPTAAAGTFAPGEVLKIDGMKVTNFSGTSGPAGLGLEVQNKANLCFTSVNTLSTGTRPQVTSILTQDLNGNGSIDHIVITFDKDLNPVGTTASTGTGFTVTLPTYQIGTASVSGKVITLSIVEKGTGDTGVRPWVSYNPSTGTPPPAPGDLKELGTGLEIGFTGPWQATDGAAPVVTGLSTLSNNNGHLDQITVQFSETLVAGQEDPLDWKIFDADGTTDLMLGTTIAISADKVVFTLTGSTGTAGTPRFVYEDNPANVNRLQDAAGNFTLKQSNNAAPTIVLAYNTISVGPSKVTMDASASTDPQGQPLTFNWVNTGFPLGATVSLQNAGTATPSFLGTKAGVYTFKVTVTNALTPATATVTVTILNVPPGADAGSLQTVTPASGFPTYLVALSSADANEPAVFAGMTYLWTQLDVPATAPPISPTSPTSTFTPPVVNNNPALPANNILNYRLAVSDTVNTSFATTQVRVNAPGGIKAPTANAGPDQVVYVGSTVQLDGSLSVDPANLPPLRYKWTSTAAMVPAAGNIVNPTFVPTQPGIYTFTLTVTNNYPLASFPSTVRILAHTPANQAPEAQAHRLEPTGEVSIGDLVVLDATGSKDPEGHALTYAWTQTTGAKVILDNPAALRPSFTPVKSATYTFQVVVSDGVNQSFPADVSLTVKDSPANTTWTTAIAKGAGFGLGGHATAGAPFTLTFTTSGASSGVPYYFYLEQLDGPAALINSAPSNQGQLAFPPTSAYTVTPPTAGYYLFRLAAHNTNLIRAFATIGVVVDAALDSTPLADAGTPPPTVTTGSTVTLDATASQNAPSTSFTGLRTFWVQREGPPVTLSDAYGAQPTFTPVAPGQYTFELKVADATGSSEPSFTVITVQQAASAPASGGSSGGCGILGLEWMLILPLLWMGSWLRNRLKKQAASSR